MSRPITAVSLPLERPAPFCFRFDDLIGLTRLVRTLHAAGVYHNTSDVASAARLSAISLHDEEAVGYLAVWEDGTYSARPPAHYDEYLVMEAGEIRALLSLIFQ